MTDGELQINSRFMKIISNIPSLILYKANNVRRKHS